MDDYALNGTKEGDGSPFQQHGEAEKHRCQALLSGRVLTGWNEQWGPGLPEGPPAEALKSYLAGLQETGLVNNREEALLKARDRIILYHLLHDPVEYLERLRSADLLDEVMPEIGALVGLEQSCPWHREDAYEHTLDVLRSLPENPSPELVLAALFHDAGKPLARTFDESAGVYHFYDHEKHSRLLIDEICRRHGWTDSDFKKEKVLWLTGNHMRVPLIFGDSRHIEKKIEKVLLRDVPLDYRQDLLSLAEMDARGSRPENPETTEDKLEKLVLLAQMTEKMAEGYEGRREEEELWKKTGSIWNGDSVIRHFGAGGPEVGRLVEMGRRFVRERLLAGDEVTEEEVRLYVENHHM